MLLHRNSENKCAIIITPIKQKEMHIVGNIVQSIENNCENTIVPIICATMTS